MRCSLISIASVLVGLVPVGPQVQAQQDTTEITRLRRQVEAISRELETLRLGQEVTPRADTGSLGFGPAASKVYRARSGVSIGGYGEVLYQNFGARRQDGAPAGLTDELDALRAIVYVGYRFDDRTHFNSEIEFEHGSTEADGAVSVEFAYLDHRFSSLLGVRAGLVLLPLGFINELHEPPTYLGTHRPETERRIIPSTWRENGVGVFGEAGPFVWRTYLINGFRGERFDASGLREGRQNGAEAAARHFAGAARVDYSGVPGLLIGAGAYAGKSGQSDSIGARTVIWEVHAEYRRSGLEIRGLYARATVAEASRLNQAAGLTGTESIGSRLSGGYLQAGYDLLRFTRSGQQLIPFVRWERLDTQDAVPAGFAADPANDGRIITLGATWKPIPAIAIKADYQINRNAADTGVDQWNVLLGYLF